MIEKILATNKSLFDDNEEIGFLSRIDEKLTFEMQHSQEIFQNNSKTSNLCMKNQVHQNINEDLMIQALSLFLNSQDQQILNNKNLNSMTTFYDSILSFSKQQQEQFNYLLKIAEKQISITNDLKNQPKYLRNKKFTTEEDELIKKIVFVFGPKNWRLVSSLLPGRTPKQCRDRYANYLAPGFIQKEWSNDEDKLLAEKYAIYGSKWTQIRQFFPLRTANDLKNRYYYTISKEINLF